MKLIIQMSRYFFCCCCSSSNKQKSSYQISNNREDREIWGIDYDSENHRHVISPTKNLIPFENQMQTNVLHDSNNNQQHSPSAIHRMQAKPIVQQEELVKNKYDHDEEDEEDEGNGLHINSRNNNNNNNHQIIDEKEEGWQLYTQEEEEEVAKYEESILISQSNSDNNNNISLKNSTLDMIDLQSS